LVFVSGAIGRDIKGGHETGSVYVPAGERIPHWGAGEKSGTTVLEHDYTLRKKLRRGNEHDEEKTEFRFHNYGSEELSPKAG
jgi:hypothetical protein